MKKNEQKENLIALAKVVGLPATTVLVTPIPLPDKAPSTKKEEDGEGFAEAWGAITDKKYLCLGCNNPKLLPIFYIGEGKDSIEGRICFVCLDICRHTHHIKVDDLHKMTSKEVKKLLEEKVPVNKDEDKLSEAKGISRDTSSDKETASSK